MPSATLRNPAPTATRVQSSTSPRVNKRILHGSEVSLARALADRESLNRRLRELDAEWDIERVLQTNFAVISLVSVALGALLSRPWFLLSGIAAGFMARHAVTGWCPPVPVFRGLGVRTTREISWERYALKAARGDFEGVNREHPARALKAADASSA